LEATGLRTYIPSHGTYKRGSEGFVSHEQEDDYTYEQDQKVFFRKMIAEKKNAT
jgi:hypothetical protein